MTKKCATTSDCVGMVPSVVVKVECGGCVMSKRVVH